MAEQRGCRPYHYLSRVKGCGLPRRLAVLATTDLVVEGDERITQRQRPMTSWHLISWSSADTQDQETRSDGGKCPQSCLQALRVLCNERGLRWVFCCEALKIMTQLGLWDELANGTWLLSGAGKNTECPASARWATCWAGLCVLEDPPTVVRLKPKGKRGQVQIVDIRNYGLKGWSSLGENQTSPPVGENGTCDAGTKALHDARGRAERLRRWALTALVSARDGQWGGIRSTSASTAFHAFRYRHLDADVLVHGNRRALRLEREAYCGGRNECFRLGQIDGPVWHADVTSMYPAVARGAQFPARLKYHFEGKELDYERLKREGHLLVCRVRLDTADPDFPWRSDWGTVYPVGRFETVLCEPELEIALARSRSVVIREALLYEPEVLFTGWVDSHFDARRLARSRGDRAGEELHKRLLVALFGKFGQKSFRWHDSEGGLGINPFEVTWGTNPITGELCRWRNLAGRQQYDDQTQENQDSCPAIAAWVCSLARSYLHSILVRVERGDCLYVDTDGLWINGRAHSRLCPYVGTDAELGQLRETSGPHPWLRVAGLKHVEWEGGQTHAGIPDGARRIGPREWHFWQSQKFDWRLSGNVVPSILESKVVYRLGKRYPYGRVTRSGRVYPLVRRDW